MAGASAPMMAPWPHGKYELIRLGPVVWETAGDTTGYKTFDAIVVPYDFYVRRAWMMLQEAGFTAGTSALVHVEDDTSTPQEIVAAEPVDANDDAGVPMEVTVDDAGPVLTGAVLKLQYDSGNSDGICRGLMMTLIVEPAFAQQDKR